ncbi:RNA recognition motif-containing protein [Besnoitia besnoiti]|uniref:RNA recognition motif-containing protein n=1 Tax=Besnoitia besnoiti TaxID=94643 RepID=A0A2A9M6S2_BESBE|nr:RNA recognition motif-containing protein [Besnoitia besnoiti]PFH31082.1 RNA recognition motif-containing protein [Besnoitia besnoiti]
MDRDRESDRPRLSLLVRNLSFHSSPEEVREAFAEFGPIRDVYLPLDYHTGEPRGFGFVEFESSQDAYDAMHQLHNTVLSGSTIHVTIAKKGRSDPLQMRRRELRGDFNRASRKQTGPRGRWNLSRSPPYRSRHSAEGRHHNNSDGSISSRRPCRSWSRDRSRRESSRSSSRRRRSPSFRRDRRCASRSRSSSWDQSRRRCECNVSSCFPPGFLGLHFFDLHQIHTEVMQPCRASE